MVPESRPLVELALVEVQTGGAAHATVAELKRSFRATLPGTAADLVVLKQGHRRSEPRCFPDPAQWELRMWAGEGR